MLGGRVVPAHALVPAGLDRAFPAPLPALRRDDVHIEGSPRGEWILMDYVDFVVHIFTPTGRSYYDLERLWGDAEKLNLAS